MYYKPQPFNETEYLSWSFNKYIKYQIIMMWNFLIFLHAYPKIIWIEKLGLQEMSINQWEFGPVVLEQLNTKRSFGVMVRLWRDLRFLELFSNCGNRRWKRLQKSNMEYFLLLTEKLLFCHGGPSFLMWSSWSSVAKGNFLDPCIF